jgi:paired amphipathic helix protein Sin3a
LSLQQNRRLDIGDSLKYLDSIKLRFLHAPHVYERFLDIMKSFKEGTYVVYALFSFFAHPTFPNSPLDRSINTTGVIQSTCELFDGHPDLIMGLVTFLPAGYYIECTTERNGANRITVVTPDRTMIRNATIGPGGCGPVRWSTVAHMRR